MATTSLVVPIPANGSPRDYEVIAVDGTVKGLTPVKYDPRGTPELRDVGRPRVALVTIEGHVRWRFDGVADPSGTDGHAASDGDVIPLSSFDQMRKFRITQHSVPGTGSNARVTYIF